MLGRSTRLSQVGKKRFGRMYILGSRARDSLLLSMWRACNSCSVGNRNIQITKRWVRKGKSGPPQIEATRLLLVEDDDSPSRPPSSDPEGGHDKGRSKVLLKRPPPDGEHELNCKLICCNRIAKCVTRRHTYLNWSIIRPF